MNNKDVKKKKFNIPVISVTILKGEYEGFINLPGYELGGNPFKEPWHQAIFTNAAVISECEWVTVCDPAFRIHCVFYWDKKPKYKALWSNTRGPLFTHDIPKILLPSDYSTAIVRIKHV